MVHIGPTTAYMTRFREFLLKKHRLAVDAWGADDSLVAHVYDPLLNLILKEIPEKNRGLYPSPVWKLTDRIGRLSRNILVAEYLVQEWADHFIGLSDEEIIDLAKSFDFSNCVKREGLNEVLTESAKLEGVI